MLYDIPVRTSTGIIPIRYSSDCDRSVSDEIARIFSIPPEPADLSLAAPVVLAEPPADAAASRLPLGKVPIFHVYSMPGNTLGLYPENSEDSFVARTWRGQFLFSLLYSILRGCRHCFLHGIVLKHRDNTVSVFFGESGVGKTTTARRFAAAGGEFLCDDQMLLHLREDNTVTVSALPTWSRVKPSCPGTNETYDVQTEYKIRRFCRLSRNPEREYLAIDSKRDFQVLLLKELTLHTFKMLKILPAEKRSVFGPHFMRFMDAIIRQWPTEILYANLDASLTDTISIE